MARKAIISNGVVQNVIVVAALEPGDVDGSACAPGDIYESGTFRKPEPTPEQIAAQAKAVLAMLDAEMPRAVEDLYEATGIKPHERIAAIIVQKQA